MRSHKKLGVKNGFKAMKKPEKTGCRSTVDSSSGKITIMIPVSSTADSTPGASTGASSTSDVFAVEVDGYGALTIPSRSLSGPDSTSNS